MVILVILVVVRVLRKLDEAADRARVARLYRFEAETGAGLIAGVDEAGRGSLFGPMVVASVILPPNLYLPRLDDSKKLSPKVRAELFDEIAARAVAYAAVEVSVEEIDALNIYQATRLGMRRAVEALAVTPEFVLADAMELELPMPTRAIVRGDSLSASIAAASVVAKVTRDRLIEALAEEFPAYGLAKNKGYGTREHMDAIRNFGYSRLHRRTFEPVKSMVGAGVGVGREI